MTSTIISENEDDMRLRKSGEFVAHCQGAENQARITLARAVEQTKRAREKHGELFMQCEKRAVERRKAGLIEVATS